MEVLKKGVEVKMDGLKKGMEGLKQGSSKLIQEMIRNGEKIVDENHD